MRERMTRIYADHRARVSGYIARRIRWEHRTWVEDLTQETFLRAWQSLPSVRVDDEHVGGWLFAIARHVMADHYRNRWAASEVPTSEDAWVWSSAASLISDDAGTRNPVVDVDAELEALPESVRDAVTLRLVNGMPAARAAAELRQSRRGVARLVEQGVCALRARLGVVA